MPMIGGNRPLGGKQWPKFPPRGQLEVALVVLEMLDMPDIEPSRRERRIRTVIVEDEAPARGRLLRFLRAHPDVEIAGEAATGAEAIALIERVMPDLVILDIKLPDFSGLEVLKRARRSSARHLLNRVRQLRDRGLRSGSDRFPA